MTYGIIGTGAVGGFYGGVLAHGGKDVHFLFHSEYEAARERGLIVKSVNGDFTVYPINAYNSTEQMPKCDVIIVSLKTCAQKLLAGMLKPILKEDSAVILIQNGLGMEPELAAQLPKTVTVAGGMAFICSNRIGPAMIHHLDLGKVSIGVHSGPVDKVKAFCQDMNSCGVECEYIENLYEFRWKKLVWNIPYNGMTVVLDTTTDYLMKNPASRVLIIDLLKEVQKGAEASGVHVPDAYIQQMIDLTDNMTPYKPSMRLDFDNRRPMEIEYMYRRPLEEARAHGVDLPKIAMLADQLQFIQDQYLKK